jgi:DNA-binding LacI/PurR family transcriptional regulator
VASMKDVAALAGVSVSTVSRVISGSIPVDQLTAQRVRDAITSLDFRPNLLAAGLRSKSGKLIGLVVPGVYEPFASIIGFLEKTTSQHGYSLLVGNSRSRADVEERFVDNLIRRHVDGIIFTPVSHETRVLEQLVDSDIPIVWFDRVWDDRRVLTVQLDNRKAGLIAAQHLTACGHRRIAIVTGPPNVDLCHDRLAGFVHGARQSGVEREPELLFEGDFSFDAGVDAVDRVLGLTRPVTAVWAQNDLMAIGLLKGFLSRGLRVPEDISIVGMDGIPFTRMVHPELTTVQQPLERMCQALLSRILDYGQLIRQQKWHAVFQPELVVRQSVRDLS